MGIDQGVPMIPAWRRLWLGAWVVLAVGPVSAQTSAPTGGRTVQERVALLCGTDERLAEEARQQLDEEAVPALTAALQTATDGACIRRISEALYWIGSPAKESAPQLERLLAARPPEDRGHIAAALAKVDPERGKQAVPELEKCVRDRVSSARSRCLSALAKVAGPEALPVLLASLHDDDPVLRSTAAEHLEDGPAETVRGPLSARLKDPHTLVRVAAASSLIRAVPDPPESAVPILLQGLCGRFANPWTVMLALKDRTQAIRVAEEHLLALLRSSDASCRMWAAVVLGDVSPHSATPALGTLREALASDDASLQGAAAHSLGAMGRNARPAIPDLEEAARTGSPQLRERAASALRSIKSIPGLAGQKADELKLVAVAERDGGRVAYLLDLLSGGVYEAGPGARLFDSQVERVEEEAVEFSIQGASPPSRLRARLFEQDKPAAPAASSKKGTARVSIDFAGDVRSLALLVGQAFGVKAVVGQADGERVRVVARGESAEAILQRALKGTGFDHRVDRGWLRIARRGRISRLRPLSSTPSGHPITLQFYEGDLRDVARLFADISGQTVHLLPGPVPELLTVFVVETPWDEALEAMAASLGRSVRHEKDLIVIESPKEAR